MLKIDKSTVLHVHAVQDTLMQTKKICKKTY